DHDYGGFRGATLRSIAGAQRQLKLALEYEQIKEIEGSQLHAAIRELQLIHAELEAANHDYGGHKGEAMKWVSTAIQDLKKTIRFEKLPPGERGAAIPKAKAGAPFQPEPQAISNAHLAHAIFELQVTKRFLEVADHDFNGFRPATLKSIGMAQRQ